MLHIPIVAASIRFSFSVVAVDMSVATTVTDKLFLFFHSLLYRFFGFCMCACVCVCSSGSAHVPVIFNYVCFRTCGDMCLCTVCMNLYLVWLYQLLGILYSCLKCACVCVCVWSET